MAKEVSEKKGLSKLKRPPSTGVVRVEAKEPGIGKAYDVSSGSERKKKLKPTTEKTTLGVNNGDYIIVKSGTRFRLAFANNPERNRAVIESTLRMDEPEVVEFDNDSLVANLGPNPVVGKVFGVHVEPLNSEKLHKIGNVLYYRPMKELESKALHYAFDKVVAKLDAEGLDAVLPFAQIQIRAGKGKYPATYMPKKLKDGTVADVIVFHPKFLDDPKANMYSLYHEIALAHWQHTVNDDTRARWLSVYNQSIKVDRAKKSQMDGLLKSLLDSQVSIREFMRDLDDAEKALMREALAYLKKHHKLSPAEVNILLNHDSRALGEIWPTSAAMSLSEVLITQRATLSVQELFAESVAHVLFGKNIPRQLEKLVSVTFKRIRSGGGGT